MPSNKTSFLEATEDYRKNPAPATPVDPDTLNPKSGYDPKLDELSQNIYKQRIALRDKVRAGESIDPEELPSWDWFMHNVDVGQVVDVGGRKLTPIMTPELYKQGAKPSGLYDPPKFAGMTAEAIDTVQRFISEIDESNPYLAREIANSPHLLATMPELVTAMTTRLGDSYVAQATLEALGGELDLYDYTKLEDQLSRLEPVAELLHQHSNSFSPDDKDLLGTLLISVPEERRSNTAALAYRYLEENPETIEDPEAKSQFFFWLYNEARKQQGEIEAQQSEFGKLGKALETPYRAVTDALSGLWSRVAAPEDHAWRKNLTLGQNVAVSLGSDPSDPSWDSISGTVDFMGAIGLDPINWAFGIGVGAKLVKSTPLMPKAIEAGRAATAMKSAIPWFGRKATKLPFGSRQISTRIYFSLFGKEVDRLVQTDKVVKVAEQIVAHNKAGKGVIELVEKFPSLKGKETGLASALGETTTVKQVQDVLRYGLAGGYVSGPEAEGLKEIVTAFHKVQDDVADRVKVLTKDNVIGAADITPDISRSLGLRAEYGAWIETGGRLAQTELSGLAEAVGAKPAARQVHMLTRTPKTLDISNPDVLADYTKWANKNKVPISEASLKNYAATKKVDAIVYADGTMEPIVSNLTRTLYDTPATGKKIDEIGKELGGLRKSLVSLDTQVRAMEGGDKAAWFIKDIPKQRNPLARLAPWAKHASNDKDGWWAARRRQQAAGLFGSMLPDRVAIWDTSEGLGEMHAWMRAFGAKRSTINKYMQSFLDATPMERHDLVNQMIREVAEEIGHPVLRFELKQISDKTGKFSTARMPGPTGEWGEAAVAFSKSRGENFVSPRPFLPAQLSDHVQLPGQNFLRTLKRYQRAEQIPIFTRGIGKTKTRREQLADRFLNSIKNTHKDANLTREEALRIAYSYVGERGFDGQGRVADIWQRGIVKPWQTTHSWFTRAMLAFRPVTWPLRVVVLEEQFRGALMDMPSMYRNPTRMMGLWWDTYLTSRRTAWKGANVTWIRNVLADEFAGVSGVDDAIFRAKNIIHNFDEVAKGRQFTSVSGVRGFVSDILQDKIIRNESVGEFSIPRAVARRMKGQRRAEARLTARYPELGVDFDWGDIVEIQNKGLANLFAEEAGTASPVLRYIDGQMTETDLRNYSYGLGRQTHRALSDPFIARFALPEIAAKAKGGRSTQTVQKLLGSSEWARMKQSVREITEYRIAKEWPGYGPELLNDDVLMAQKYLDDIVIPYARELFAPFLGDDPEQVARVADKFANGQMADITLPNGKTYTVDPSADYDVFVRQMQDMVIDTSNQNLKVPWPQEVSGYFDPKFLDRSQDNFYKSVTGKIINFSGEKVTQAFNRRPAYLDHFRQVADHYKTIGLPDDLVTELAHMEAAKRVNYVYYNMGNPTPFLKQMNGIVPFFAAMWEVAQTWSYKIPAQSSLGLGYVRMARQIDKTFKALLAVGILEVDDAFTNEDGTLTTPLRLRFSPQPDTGTELGDAISKGGHMMMSTPHTVVGHLIDLWNELRGNSDGGVFDDLPDYDYTFAVGNPLDPTSHGIMATQQISLGVSPIGQPILQKIVNNIPFAGDLEYRDTVTGDTVQKLASDMEMTVQQLLSSNRAVLKDALGSEVYNNLMQGIIVDAEVPEKLVLKRPNSSLARTLVNETFFPFGQQHNVYGTVYQFVPSWAQYALKGLALHQASNTGEPWNVKDGVMHWQNGVGGAFLETLLPPEQQAQMAGLVSEALFHLEATDVDENGVGILSRWAAAADKLGQFLEQSTIEIEYDNGEPVIKSVGHEDEAKFQELNDDVEALNDEIVARATDIAATSSLLRGLVGVLAPGNPTLLQRELEERAVYYNTRDAAERLREGGSVVLAEERLPKISRPQDVNNFMELTARWIQDETGDASKRFLKDKYPALLPFLVGKTFWGPGGEPPEVKAYDEYVAEMRAGRRLPVPPDIQMQRVARQSLALEREAAITDAYPGDPTMSALQIFKYPQEYQQINDTFKTALWGLDYYDDLHNENGYLRWRQRNRDDAPTLQSELHLRYQNIVESVDVLEAIAPELDMTSAELKEMSQQMGRVARALKDNISAWREETTNQNYSNPREQVVTQYYETVVTPFFDALEEKYNAIAEAKDSEDRSRAFEDLRLFTTDEYVLRPSINGVEFPNVLEWSWNKKDDEARNLEYYKLLRYDPSWLNLADASRLVEKAPALAPYLPHRQQDFTIYRQYNLEVQALQDMKEPTPDNLFPMSDTEYNKRKSLLDDALVLGLQMAGREGEAEFVDKTPAQRLQIAGMLPEAMVPFVKQISSVKAWAEANEVATYGQDADVLYGAVYLNFLQSMESDPYLRSEFERLGEEMYDEFDYDVLFYKLFTGSGSVYGEI